MKKTLEMNDDEHQTLRRLLDAAGDKLREITDEEDATRIADGCDHWLEIIEAL